MDFWPKINIIEGNVCQKTKCRFINECKSQFSISKLIRFILIFLELVDYWPKIYLSNFVSLPWKLDNPYCHIIHAHLTLEFPPGLLKCIPFAVVRKKECFICIAFNSQVDAKMLAKKHKWFPLLPCCAD